MIFPIYTWKHAAKVARFNSTYLLQQDVLVDDSLVPLGVRALATVLGPPLVLSTGGRWTGKELGEGKREGGGETPKWETAVHRRGGASGDEWTTTTMQREQQQSGAGHTTGRLSRGENDVMHTVWMFASFFLFFFLDSRARAAGNNVRGLLQKSPSNCWNLSLLELV